MSNYSKFKPKIQTTYQKLVHGSVGAIENYLEINGYTQYALLSSYNFIGSAILNSLPNYYNWKITTIPTTTFLYAAIYGGVYVYAGDGGTLASSTDAINWTSRTSGTTSTIFALTYGNGVYVYAGAGGVLRTSTNGTNWTSRTSGTTSGIRALTYGNGLYVYGGVGGVLATSTNATNWTARTSGTTSQIRALTYGNGLYLYAGDGGVLASSTDAINWTAQTSGTASQINALTYGNGFFLYGANGGNNFAKSTDTVTWTFPNIGGIIVDWNALSYGNDVYVAVGNQGALITSTNTINWTSTKNKSNTINQFVALASNNVDTFIAVSNNSTEVFYSYANNLIDAVIFPLPNVNVNITNMTSKPKIFLR